MQRPWLTADGQDSLLKTHVKTRQQEEQFIFDEESLIVKIKASPTKGKANKRLIQLFRKTFNTEVILESGTTSPWKIFRLKRINPEKVLDTLYKR